MKIKINIKSIIFMTIISIITMLFINISFATNKGKIAVETAKLREEPNTDSKVLELASAGEEIEILEEVDSWYKVKYKNITGYLRTDLVQVENKDVKNTNTAEQNQNTSTEVMTTENITSKNTTTVENTTTETNTTPIKENVIEKGKYKTSEDVKLKIIPLISAIELNEVKKDAEVEVTEILNDWAKVKTADGKEGWLRIEKIVKIENKPEESNEQKTTETSAPAQTQQQATKTMYVNSQSINVRQKADKTSQVVKQLTVNTQVTVLSTQNGWAYVDINGVKGYIAENLLSTTKQQTSRSSTTTRGTTNTSTTSAQNKTNTTQTTQSATNAGATTSVAPSSGKGSSVVSYAKQFLGCKYVYGGTTTSGFDCSGFTQYVYRHFGVNLNRTAAAQYSNGTPVTNLQPGDLLMFGKSGINHVGIYMGGNSFIHAANSSRGVTTDSMSSGYYKSNYVGARRIF